MSPESKTNAHRTQRRRRESVWFGPLPIALGFAISIVLLIGWRFVANPNRPSKQIKIDPLPTRFIDVAGAVAPLYLYGRATEDGLLFAGDSRIGSDISVRVLERRGLGTVGLLWNGFAQFDHVLDGARMLPPRRLVMSVTPTSVYLPPAKRMADLLAKERARRITQRIDERLDDEVDVWRRKTFFTWEPNPWGGGEAGVVLEPRRHEGTYIGLLGLKTRDKRRERVSVMQADLASMIKDGWRVACVRFPVSEGMRKLEDDAFPSEQFTQVCAELGIPYLDMKDTDYQTSDASHLLGADAERCTERIADWLLTLPGMSGPP
jgi:hypothetical protein